MTIQNKRYFSFLILIPLLLLVPLVAMQFSNEVDWSLVDFVVMGSLLFVLVSVIEFLFRNVKSRKHLVILSGLVLLSFLLIWAELAVGIFGTPFAGS